MGLAYIISMYHVPSYDDCMVLMMTLEVAPHTTDTLYFVNCLALWTFFVCSVEVVSSLSIKYDPIL